MKNEHIELVSKINKVLKPIIENAMVNEQIKIADIVYCAMFSSEEVALETKRRNKLPD